MSADYDFPPSFLGISARPDRLIHPMFYEGHPSRRYVDAYKFDSRTGRWVAGRDIDDTRLDLKARLLWRIESVFRHFMKTNGNFQDVTAYIYGTEDFSLKIV